MYKRLLADFFKDSRVFTIAFFSNTVVIAVFYWLSTGSRVEVLYPALLSLFIYSIAMALKWSRYLPYNAGLEKCSGDAQRDLAPATCEQKRACGLIADINRSSMERLQKEQFEYSQNNRFITQWIHNMKTPVSVINLVVQKAKAGETEAADALEDISEENERLLANLDQVLNLLRLEDFSRDYLPQGTDLAASVRKLINLRKNQFIYSRVFPKLELPPESVFVLTDAKWNEVMLDQIISNAVKYSNSGEGTKTVYFTIEDRGREVELKIRDEGVGIPDYDLKRVFEPFFTGENGRKFQNATGIGLYVCSAIAGKLGHRLGIRSRPGEGTEVSVTYLSKP